MQRSKKILWFILIIVLLAVAIGLVVVFSVRGHVHEPDGIQNRDYDCILILGCGIKDDETPSDMLRDRLETGIDLYNRGVSDRILVSGDNGQKGYNEIHVMLHYLLDRGVPAEAVFCDHAGFNTYDSMHRAGSIFGAERMIIVTQRYHLFRALYIARHLGIEADGCCADIRRYRGAAYRELREVAARGKDFFKVLVKAEPRYGGEAIDLDGDSRLSWERSELETIQ